MVTTNLTIMLSIIISITIFVLPIVLIIWLIIYRKIKKNIPEELKGGNNNGIQKEKQKGSGGRGDRRDGGGFGREGRRERRIRELESSIERRGRTGRGEVEGFTQQQRRVQTDTTLDTEKPERDIKRNWTEFS